MPSAPSTLIVALAVGLLVAAIAVALLGWGCYRLLRDRGRLLLRQVPDDLDPARLARSGLPAGSMLPDFALPSAVGADPRTITLSGLSGRPLLLIVVREGCLYSRAVVRELAASLAADDAPLPVMIVTGDPEQSALLGHAARQPGPVLRDAHGQAARLLRIAATPAGYLVDATRRTRGPVLAGPAALLAAARGALPETLPALSLAITDLPARRPMTLIALGAGEAAPDFTAKRLDGGAWSLAAQRGTAFTLIFSDPGCPPCRALLGTLAAGVPPPVVIVSSGDPDDDRQLAAELGITLPYLQGNGRQIARLYGTLETPAAYAIDTRGTIAAGPAIGAAAILAMARNAGPGAGR